MEQSSSGEAEPAVRPKAGPAVGEAAAGPGEGLWRYSAVACEAAVPQIRHAVRDRLLAQGLWGPRYRDLVDDLLLVVSELLGNAVTHAAALSPSVTTELSIRDGWVRVSVADGHPHRPKARVGDREEQGGRGLLLVKSITLQAGGLCDCDDARDGAGGKVIWVALPLTGGPGRGGALPERGGVLPGR